MAAELATHNGEWIVSHRDTMATFVDAVVVTDRSHAYQHFYATVHAAVQHDDWDAALAAALRLRKYAHTASDRDGEKLAALLTSFAFTALELYREADQALSLMFIGEVAPLGMWHGALAHTARGIAAYAQGDTDDAVALMQDALDYLDHLADWTTQERMYHVHCSPSRKAAYQLACDANHIYTRGRLRGALREAIRVLAVTA